MGENYQTIICWFGMVLQTFAKLSNTNLFTGDAMNYILHPTHMLCFFLASWVNREQQRAIEYLRAENKVLRDQLGKERILLNDSQRRRLAVKGKVLGRKLLAEVGTLFTPDTILRWHWELVARKWDYSQQRKSVGRPRVRQGIVELILKFAHENPTWGCDRIQGALMNVGYHLSDRTVGNVLKAHGVEPAPDRTPNLSWKTFLQAHWETIFATDFTTVEVWTKQGLTTFYLMVVMHLKTRQAEIAGVTTNPNSQWMLQTCRNLTDDEGFLSDASHLIVDRDSSFKPLRDYLREQTETEVVLLPPKSPNLNVYLKRFMRSIKTECRGKMIFFGRKSLEHTLKEYVAHYHAERNHQGLKYRLINSGEEVGNTDG